ncbi:hypothetical protein K402DRAFT_333974 [Aulographum hederae CBS 113979]|uniref:Uncharacterized protein n=1 Tax=Aulographum hederae CBS 113979 TaxID=1176131 RepID=A0A6G1GXZ7_9PEZI|nr:hypothetical protein K402DRAFT_333974 [Aulographum hederae CBS 113979]
MRFSTAIASTAALAAGANAMFNGSMVYETKVLTEYTTFCPFATEVVHGDMTYTVTEATTLTITNCPCTVTYPVSTSVVSECSTW